MLYLYLIILMVKIDILVILIDDKLYKRKSNIKTLFEKSTI